MKVTYEKPHIKVIEFKFDESVATVSGEQSDLIPCIVTEAR